MLFVNEAIGLIALIGLVIAEVRLVKCKGTAGRQTADSSTIGCLLVPNTFLDDKTKIFSLKLSCYNNNKKNSRISIHTEHPHKSQIKTNR